jgi:hypothetical protein
MEDEPKSPSPAYPPEEVARAILKCAEKPVREVFIGGVPRLQSMFAKMAPRLTDVFMERHQWNQLHSGKPPYSGDSLDAPSGEQYGLRRAGEAGYVTKSSAYTRAAMSDVMRAAPFVLVGAVIAATVAARR